MSQQQSVFDKAMALIDAANGEDPNHENVDGKDWPKELIYSHRMSDMLTRYTPDADDAMKLAIHAQHVQRWKTPRDAYEMNRIGYLKWRKGLYKFHAQTAADLLTQAGYSDDVIERVKQAVAKKGGNSQPGHEVAGRCGRSCFH